MTSPDIILIANTENAVESMFLFTEIYLFNRVVS